MVTRQRLGEQVADALIEAILAGEYPLGEYLPTEAGLIEAFGVSRTAVREALRVLSARGFVTVVHGKGARVSAKHPQAISSLLRFQLRQQGGTAEHVMEVRRMLEMTAAGLAAQRATPADLAAMDAALAEMAGSTGARSYIAADMAFHEALMRAAHNPVLALLNDAVTHLLRGMREQTYLVRGAVARSLEDHRWLYEAVADHDPARAQSVMQAILDSVEQAVHRAEAGGGGRP
jgi:GntR family transcriptional repressor for pyruvate dehydrogenase complex